METMEVNQVMSYFPETKEQISIFSEKMVNSVLEGDVNPLKTETQLVCVENVCKSIRKDERYKESLLKEAEKYGQKTFNAYNAEIQIKEVGVKYDFLNCGHPEYIDIINKISVLDEKRKELEKELKAHSKSWIYTDINNGDQYEVFPPAKTSTTSVVTTIKK